MEGSTFRVGAGDGSVRRSYMTSAQGVVHEVCTLAVFKLKGTTCRVPARVIRYAYGRYVPNQGRDSRTKGGILKEYRNK